MKRLVVTLFFALLVLTPQDVFGCTCYASDDGLPVSLSANARCREADLCNEASAEESATEGVCECSTSSETFSCTDFCNSQTGYSGSPPTTSSTTPTPVKLLTPTLSIDIPGVTFTDITSKKSAAGETTLSINYLGDYIAGVYKYLLGVSTLIAIVMLMIGGLQYSIFQEDKAKTRIKNAVTGLVLLLSTYLILTIVNPRLVLLGPIELTSIPVNELALKYTTEAEAKTSCKDRTKIVLTDADKSSMASPYTSLTVPAASTCSGTKVPQSMRDEGFRAQQSTGVPAAILLAQWAVESGYGEHCVGAHNNNCWGIKCSSGGSYAGNDTLVSTGSKPTCPSGCQAYKTKEVKNGVADDYWACFQDFTTLSEAMARHATVVKKKGWDSYNGSPETFAKFVQNNCYATALNYASAITAAMKKQCLYTP